MTVARIILQPDSDAGRRCECREGAGVNLEGGDGGHLRGTRRRAWGASAAVGGGGAGAPAAVNRRDDAFVGGQDIVDRVVDAEVVRFKRENSCSGSRPSASRRVRCCCDEAAPTTSTLLSRRRTKRISCWRASETREGG